ncbi:MAG TPA: heavy metal-binding domain-containing protein [Candidatus Limnocylindria bacterium]
MGTRVATASGSLLPSIGRFGLHFLEMCVVMCMGGGALDAAVFGIAAALGLDIAAQAPLLAIFLIAFDGALVMATWMLLRRHALRHNLEMSGATLIGATPFLVAYAVGWSPADLSTWTRYFSWICGPLCVLMFFVMLVRFDHYAGRVSAAVLATNEAGDFTCSMHPVVRRASPGACPVCGMTLVRRA